MRPCLEMEFRIWEARALNNRLIVPGQQTLCFAQTRDAHGLKILFEEGASGIQIRPPQTHGFAADVRKGLGELPAVSALYFAQGLATRVIGCEGGKVIIGIPAHEICPFDRLELAVRQFQRLFGRCSAGRQR